MKTTSWIYSDLRPIENAYIIEDVEETRGIATVHGAEENAKLIAAAPELLEALEGMVKLVAWNVEETIKHEGLDFLQSDVKKAVLAIKKAKG